MKRGIAAVIIFCICLTSSVFCTYKNNKILENTRIKIDTIKEYCVSGNYNNAKEYSDILKKEWVKDRFILETTLGRSAVKNIENTVFFLPTLTNEKNADDAIKSCNDAIFEIDYLIEKEKISLKNVF